MRGRTRRRFLRVALAGLATGLAGCGMPGDEGEGGEEDDEGDDGTEGGESDEGEENGEDDDRAPPGSGPNA